MAKAIAPIDASVIIFWKTALPFALHLAINRRCLHPLLYCVTWHAIFSKAIRTFYAQICTVPFLELDGSKEELC